MQTIASDIKQIFIKGRPEVFHEEYDIVLAIEKIKSDIVCVQKILDNITDPILIDSFLFEEKALNLRFQYYINLCRDKKISVNAFARGGAE